MTKFDIVRKSLEVCVNTDGCCGCMFFEDGRNTGCIQRLLEELALLLKDIERGGMVAWHDGSPEVSGDYIANSVDFDGRPTGFLSVLHYSAQYDAFNAHDGCDRTPETDIKVYKWTKVLPPNVIEDAE